MLSRVAERTYWLARYLERAENAARLVDVYSTLLLDLPAATNLAWRVVLEITGSSKSFAASGRSASDRDMLEFMLADLTNPNSLLSALRLARENARTTRDIVPAEGWRAVNELYLMAVDGLPRAISPRHRATVLADVVQRAQHVTGLLAGTMSHGTAYQFLRLGRNLERADMTTRMIDIALALRVTASETLQRRENTLWISVLRSLSAYQMYRQYVRRRVKGDDVMEFLLTDRDFPRSVAHCLHEALAALASLPRADVAVTQARLCLDHLAGVQVREADPSTVRNLLDQLQIEIAGISDALAKTWFYLGDAS